MLAPVRFTVLVPDVVRAPVPEMMPDSVNVPVEAWLSARGSLRTIPVEIVGEAVPVTLRAAVPAETSKVRAFAPLTV